MKLLQGIEAVDLGAYVKKEDCFIIADVHIGYEQNMQDQGVLVPLNQLKMTINRFNGILKRLKKKKFKHIVVNGDLKHEFGKISRQEWKDVIKFIEYLESKCDELIIIEGNHDIILEPITKKKEINIVEYLILDNILVLHGNYVPEHLPKVDTIIIGHEHPAVSFKSRPQEKYKCFLLGKWKRKHLIVLPSFFLPIPGTDITKENLLSPFLKNIKNFEVFVVEDKVRKFGKVKELERI